MAIMMISNESDYQPATDVEPGAQGERDHSVRTRQLQALGFDKVLLRPGSCYACVLRLKSAEHDILSKNRGVQ